MVIVAIIGVDGCGKTTQARMLADRLSGIGYKAMYIRPVFVLFDFLTRSENKNITPISPREISTSKINASGGKRKSFIIKKLFIGLFGYLYALTTYIIMKLYLNRNNIIVCDRYFYQFFFDVFGNLSEAVIKIFPCADITYFLDGGLTIFYSRMDNSFDTSVEMDYYKNVLDLYRRISVKYGFNEIDASLNREVINNIIFTHLIKEMRSDCYE